MTKKQKLIAVGKRGYSIDLPKLVVRTIFSFLDIKSLGRCELCCSSFYHLIREDSFMWKSVYCNTWSSCALEVMDDEENWKLQTQNRCETEDSHSINLLSFKEDLLDFVATDSMEDMLESLKYLQVAVPQLRDTLRVKQELERNGNIPSWLIEGTYFRSSSFYKYDGSAEICEISWTTYGKSGIAVEFMLFYHYEDSRSYKISIRVDHSASGTEIILFERLKPAYGIIVPESDPVEAFNELKRLWGAHDLMPSQLFDYITACTHFREKNERDSTQKRYFTFDINSKKHWATFYQENDMDN